jgi:hypothetical protein
MQNTLIILTCSDEIIDPSINDTFQGSRVINHIDLYAKNDNYLRKHKDTYDVLSVVGFLEIGDFRYMTIVKGYTPEMLKSYLSPCCPPGILIELTPNNLPTLKECSKVLEEVYELGRKFRVSGDLYQVIYEWMFGRFDLMLNYY